MVITGAETAIDPQGGLVLYYFINASTQLVLEH